MIFRRRQAVRGGAVPREALVSARRDLKYKSLR
jgi:hypothetical protein